MTNKKSKESKQTVSKEVFAFWKMHFAYGDIGLLSEELGVSRPVITKALNKGIVARPSTVEAITTFYKKRQDANKL